jgi:hypothetical protein
MNGRPGSGKLQTPPLLRALMRHLGSWLVVLGAGHNLYGQSCAMCYTTVAGGGTHVIRALQGGIIVLLIPPVLLFSGLIILLFRWRTSAVSRTRGLGLPESMNSVDSLSPSRRMERADLGLGLSMRPSSIGKSSP